MCYIRFEVTGGFDFSKEGSANQLSPDVFQRMTLSGLSQ